MANQTIIMYFVYVLVSEQNGRFYIGQTNNLKARLERHNAGLENYTSKFTPWNLQYYIEVPTRKDAMKLERYLKNLHSPKKVIEWFKKKGVVSNR